MNSNDIKVGVEIKAIPDGFVGEGADRRLLLSLIIMPVPPGDTTKGQTVPLGMWPQIINENAASMKIKVRPLNAKGGGTSIPDGNVQLIKTGVSQTADSFRKLNAAWNDILRLCDPEECKVVASVFENVGTRVARSRDEGAFDGAIMSYPVADLAAVHTSLQGTLAALEAARHMTASDKDLLRLTKALNPKSAAAQQSDVIKLQLGLNETTSIRAWTRENYPARPGPSPSGRYAAAGSWTLDALRRVAWTGRERAPAPITFSAQSARDDVDDVHVPVSVAQNLYDKMNLAAASRSVFSGIHKNAALSGDFLHTIKESIYNFSEYYKNIPINYKSDHKSANAWRDFNLSSLSVLTGQMKVSTSRDSFLEHGYASYLLGMIPDRSNFLKTLQKSGRKAATTRPAKDDEGDSSSIIRKLSALLAYPDVARLFGLIVDLSVPVAAIRSLFSKGELFEIAAEFSTTLQTRSLFTAAKLIEDSDPNEFSALSLAEFIHDRSLVPSVFQQGLVLLGAPHYEIITVDVNAAIEGSAGASKSDQTQGENGEQLANTESGIPSQRTTGLALIDRDRLWKANLEAILAAIDDEVEKSGGEPRPLLLDDLVGGYRVDAGTVDSANFDSGNVDSCNIEWRSLSNRVLLFPDLEEQLGLHPNDLSSKHSIARERMNGHVRAAHREMKISEETKGGSINVAFAYDTICTWRNWNFALPSQRQVIPRATGGSLPPDELQLSVTMRLPNSDFKAQRMPAQRTGRRYCFGARAVLLNGSSASFETAREAYCAHSNRYVAWRGAAENLNKVHPAPGDKIPGYPFLRHEPVASPAVYYTKQTEGSTPVDDNVAPEYLNHDTTVIVAKPDLPLKWNDGARYLLVGSASLDLCELDGALDVFDQLPADSYRSIRPYPSLKMPTSDPQELRVNATDGELVRYYADPMAEVMVIGFFKDGDPVWPGEYPEPIAINLFPGSRRWPNIIPVRLIAAPVDHAGPISHSGQRAAFHVETTPGEVIVRVDVEPAEIAELRVWCLPRSTASLEKLAGVEQMVRQAVVLKNLLPSNKKLAPDTKLGRALSDALGKVDSGQLATAGATSKADRGNLPSFARPPALPAPIQGISHSTKLTCVHAVASPVQNPSIENLWALHRVDAGRKDEADSEILKAWSDLVTGPQNLNGETLRSQIAAQELPGSQKILLGGLLRFHRRSTGKIVLRAKWEDFSPTIKPVRKNDRFIYVASKRMDPLCDISHINYDPIGSEKQDEVDLVRDKLGNARLITKELESTRAVRFQVEAEAATRFASHFKSLPAPLASQMVEICVPSSRRPDPVNVMDLSSVIYQNGGHTIFLDPTSDPAQVNVLSRTIRLRLDLGTSWYSSGFEEMLGLVCWPADLFSNVDSTLHITAPDTGIPKFATVWGRDPVRETGEVHRLLPASAFTNCIKTVRCLIPIPVEQRKGPSTVECCLALFEPTVDPETGSFFCDIEIDPGSSYNPFVSLGLVRYQACSLKGLEASEPLTRGASIMPKRHLMVRSDNGDVVLDYFGTAYNGLNNGLGSGSSQVPQTPLVDITVMRRANGLNYSGLPLPLAGAPTMTEAEVTGLPPCALDDGFKARWRARIVPIAQEGMCQPCEGEVRIPVHQANFGNGMMVLVKESETYMSDNGNVSRAASSVSLDVFVAEPEPSK